MKLLFVYAFFSHGGCETVLYTRQKTLKSFGEDCHLLFLSPDTGDVFASDRDIFFLRSPQSIQALLRRHRYDLISVVDSPAFYPNLAASGFTGAVVNECHTSNPLYLEYIRKLANTGRPDAFLVPGRHLVDYLRDRYHPSAPLYTIPNGIDFTLFRFRTAACDSADWTAPPGRKILAWVGRFENAKQPLAFLQLARALKDNDPGLFLWMAGSKTYAPLLDQVLAEVGRLGLQDSFRHLSAIPYRCMPLFYSAVAESGGCVIATSERECYPMVPIEAAACRCPVVATAIPGHREVILPGETGLLFPLHDLSAGAGAVSQVLYSLSLRSRLIDCAQEYVRRHNDITPIARALRDTFASIIATHSGHSG